MSCKQCPFIVEDDLSPCVKESLHEVIVLLSEQSWHQDVNRVPNYFSLVIAEDIRKPLTCLYDFANWIFASAYMNDSGIISEKDITWYFGMLINRFLLILIGFCLPNEDVA